MPHALVTGASGFAGPFLIQHLLKEGYEVTGAVHGPDKKLPGECHAVSLDVTDARAVRRTVAELSPDEVYHLAGLTRPASGAVGEFYAVNFGGALNLLEAAREEAPEIGILLVGSAYAYGRVDRPIAESEPLNPTNHYGVSKAAADMLGHSYALQGLRVVGVRPFNHSGPGQSPDFLLPTLVEQFAEIKAGRREPSVKLGNLDSVRDLSDVRDVVRAYVLALRKGNPGEAYNVGSGRGIPVRELFEMVRRQAGVEVELIVEPSRVRAGDIPYLVADINKTGKELGWRPTMPLERTVREMLEAAGAV
ncbi:MAG TPA: GDP-mannose 4,6-dehydratase [Rubrobacteraceae bacterium]|nr:GDP-mannose 4,6-dehydratase [Rubrobacteraceae bacterium]